jgi:uncharacterized protein
MVDRRIFLGAGLVAFGFAVLDGAHVLRRTGEEALAGTAAGRPLKDAEPWAADLVTAAERQVGETRIYDPTYVRLAYPGGDVPRDRGVCTDVVIRAYRDALGIDLQREVHQDMAANFSAYPAIWGLKRADRNIDHRRVPNLRKFLERRGAALPVPDDVGEFLPGDLVTQMLPGNLPHIAIVTRSLAADGRTPLVVHNIGAGARIEDTLTAFAITGRYRFNG